MRDLNVFCPHAEDLRRCLFARDGIIHNRSGKMALSLTQTLSAEKEVLQVGVMTEAR